MTKGRQRTITVLLAVFCVLLAMNLVKGEPEAQAQHGPPFDSAEPTVVGMALEKVSPTDRVWRIWSDGRMETRRRQPDPSGGNGVCWRTLGVGFNDWIAVEDCP